MKKTPMIGFKFGRLTVLEDSGKKRGEFTYKCLCDCGNIKIITGASLRSGNSKSCGCLKKELLLQRTVKHGMYRTPTYNVWVSMIQRCTNQNNPRYNDWGGRGITVCDRWLRSFKLFYKDMGDMPKGLTIERINNDKGYSKKNCIWATQIAQNRNQRIGKNNKTGIPGIHWSHRRKRYIAQICTNYKTHLIGQYKTIEEAAIARKNAEKIYWT
uniref:Putative HNH endonuclease n=1 Tax=viral metagenome TaxID=1070528 RepID=A0A6M3JM96_9ZZZZ